MNSCGTFDTAIQNAINYGEGHVCRIVLTKDELTEKVTILENKLNDSVIEKIKKIYVDKLKEEFPDIKFKNVLFSIDGGIYCLQVLSNHPQIIRIDKELYEDIRNTADNYVTDKYFVSWKLNPHVL